MILKNSYTRQLIKQYDSFLKKENVKQRKIKSYVLLATCVKQTGENDTKVMLQLRGLEKITSDFDNKGYWATLETTLKPDSYVYKLLDDDVAEYAKRGIRIEMCKYNLRW